MATLSRDTKLRLSKTTWLDPVDVNVMCNERSRGGARVAICRPGVGITSGVSA